MKITHFGHACVQLEFETPDPTRILIDPGTYSQGFDTGGDIEGLLFTHAHPDHIDMDRVPALAKANPTVQVIADIGCAAILSDHGITHHVAIDGSTSTVGAIRIDALAGDHATIHCDMPNLTNNGYVIDERVLHPGDAFIKPSGSVEVLLLPVGGPWMKVGEAIDYLRAVNPRIVIPIHQAGLAPVHQNLHYSLLRNLGPANCEVVVLEQGVATTI
ncbi:MBL fold metallo-hydrolase [Mycolicibacterium sp. lyk4-40-TYG-92]|uniref:MBL fold metallo-hydrolase n=1 Tax=Mycolicibacterium sp. lyk4-40-TYG-92 TaxID=3040295 RepID=UPI00254FC996|nr:MBL fold metallo-hydrolase [Mycolicibacterium sp. lyk4-40-TYG-92]